MAAKKPDVKVVEDVKVVKGRKRRTAARAADPGATPRGNGNEPVDIKTLLYKGAGARQRAQELREAAKRASGESLRAIIDEVCDLVVLAIEPE